MRKRREPRPFESRTDEKFSRSGSEDPWNTSEIIVFHRKLKWPYEQWDRERERGKKRNRISNSRNPEIYATLFNCKNYPFKCNFIYVLCYYIDLYLFYVILYYMKYFLWVRYVSYSVLYNISIRV